MTTEEQLKKALEQLAKSRELQLKYLNRMKYYRDEQTTTTMNYHGTWCSGAEEICSQVSRELDEILSF